MDSNTIALDASAFYAGVPFGTTESSSYTYVTTPIIYDEISHIKSSHDAIGALLATGKLSLMSPESEYVKDARRLASDTGDIPNLSEQDLSIIALCLQARLALVTDDYAVSNVMRSLNLPTISVMTRGIKHHRMWQYYCPGCGNTPRIDDTAIVRGKAIKSIHISSFKKHTKSSPKRNIECELCGSALKRRLIK